MRVRPRVNKTQASRSKFRHVSRAQLHAILDRVTGGRRSNSAELSTFFALRALVTGDSAT